MELRKAVRRRAATAAAEPKIVLRLVGGAPASRAIRLLRSHQAGTANGKPLVIQLVLDAPGKANSAKLPTAKLVSDEAPREARVVRFGDVAVDLAARAVTRLGVPVELTPRQFDLLAALVRSEGQAMSRQDLIDAAWPDADGSGARTVDTHIWHLRHRLEIDATAPRHIMTVKKTGYRFQR